MGVTDPEVEEDEARGEDSSEAPIYEQSCVWLAADPDHIPDDARPLHGCATCPCGPATPGGTCDHLLQVKLNPQRIQAFELDLGSSLEDSTGDANCLLGSVHLQCKRAGFKWTPKDPSPLAERIAELGGCELQRLLDCPVVLGFLKPAVTVRLTGGKRILLPLDECGEVSVLRARLVEELSEEDNNNDGHLELAAEDGIPLPVSYFPGPTRLLCARPGESLAATRLALSAEKAGKEEDLACVPEGDGMVVDVALEEVAEEEEDDEVV